MRWVLIQSGREMTSALPQTHDAHLLDGNRHVVEMPLVAVAKRSRAQECLERDLPGSNLEPCRHGCCECGCPQVNDFRLLFVERVQGELALDPLVLLKQLEPLQLHPILFLFGLSDSQLAARDDENERDDDLWGACGGRSAAGKWREKKEGRGRERRGEGIGWEGKERQGKGREGKGREGERVHLLPLRPISLLASVISLICCADAASVEPSADIIAATLGPHMHAFQMPLNRALKVDMKELGVDGFSLYLLYPET